jgi:hypothetical protein
MELDPEVVRHAKTWEWIQRVGAAAVLPVLAVSVSSWSDVRAHLKHEGDYEPKHLEQHEVITTFVAQGGRFTKEDAYKLEQDIKVWVEQRYPPKWMQDDLAEIKEIVRQNQRDIQDLQKTVEVIKNGK